MNAHGPAPLVLFADFDGVVARSVYGARAEERLVPEQVRRLDTIVARSGALVVVSSSWREVASPEMLTGWLGGAGFSGRVYDVTPIHAPCGSGFADPTIRTKEIEAWLAAQAVPPARYVVLDDVRVHGRVGRNLVLTNERVGLTDADVARALAILGVC